jgi:predicted phosphoadenosine phosphosulfate sulfurtransferase
MEFEEFVVDFAQWLAKGEEWAVGVGIRSNESFNRYRTLFDSRKQPYKEKPWTTLVVDNVFNFYPIYDWTTEDIWTAVGKFDYSYNHIYDLMYQQGKSIHECRICQPYGDDQRKGLDLFRTCEPETWAKVVDRVAGSNFGNIYCRSYLLGHMKVVLPEGHTWKTYTEFLLATIPKCEAEWYMTKFRVFIKWWEDKGYPADEWPDAKLKKGDDRLIGPDGRQYTKGPAWERLAKCILKNDKLCKSLSFAATKGQYSKYQRMKEEYGY